MSRTKRLIQQCDKVLTRFNYGNEGAYFYQLIASNMCGHCEHIAYNASSKMHSTSGGILSLLAHEAVEHLSGACLILLGTSPVKNLAQWMTVETKLILWCREARTSCLTQ